MTAAMNHNAKNRWDRRSARGQGCLTRRTESVGLIVTLQQAYSRLAPAGTSTTMPDDLRAWLRAWAVRHALDRDQVQAFVTTHQGGLVATLDAVHHDLSTAHLLAPELLLVLAAIDQDPDRLRECWPADRDVAELLSLAEDFGRPFVS
jgi:hypothetical protein